MADPIMQSPGTEDQPPEKEMERLQESVITSSRDEGLMMCVIFDVILKEYNGMAAYKYVRHLFPPFVDIQKLLTTGDHSDRFHAITDIDTGKVCQMGVRCILPLCLDYCYGITCKENCPYLHICHNYLHSQCPNNCNRVHSFKSDHNLRIFNSKGLGKYSEEELKILMSRSFLQVCDAYNDSRCTRGETCFDLHVCASYIAGKCYSGECKLDHTFNSTHSRRLITVFKLQRIMQQGNINKLKRCILVHKPTFKPKKGKPTTTQLDPVLEIGDKFQLCFRYMSGGCYQKNCPLFHICYRFIESQCELEEKCRWSHSFRDGHNRRVAYAQGLSQLSKEQLKKSLYSAIQMPRPYDIRERYVKIGAVRDEMSFTSGHRSPWSHYDVACGSKVRQAHQVYVVPGFGNNYQSNYYDYAKAFSVNSFKRDSKPNLKSCLRPTHFSQNPNAEEGQLEKQSGSSISTSWKYTDDMSTFLPFQHPSEAQKCSYTVDKDENDKNSTKKVDMDENDDNTIYTVDTDENGGFFHMPNIKSQLYIPDGALTEETMIQIIEHNEETLGQEKDLGFKSRAISNIHEFLPHGQRFMKYVTFRFPLQLIHRFDVGGLKILYSATGRGEKVYWQEIPLKASREDGSGGLSWLVWERHCYVMMQHFCKIRVIMTNSCAQDSALYVNVSLIGQYLEQLQLVEMSVVFSCGEKDDRDHRQIFNSGKKVLAEKVLLVYDNDGDIHMKFALHDNQDWQVDEDEQSQVLDKNILFLEPLCELKTLPDMAFTIQKKQSTLLRGKITLKQNKRENGKMFIFNLDVKELQHDTEKIISTLKKEKEKLQQEKKIELEQKEKLISQNQEMQKEKEKLMKNCKRLEEEKQTEQEQKQKFQDDLEKVQKKDGGKIINGPQGEKLKKKSQLPVLTSRGTRENSSNRDAVNDVASTSQSRNDAAANCNYIDHAPEQVSQCFLRKIENKSNIVIYQTISNTYNEPGSHGNGLLALEDKTWPTGFDSEFYKYMFEFRAELDKDKTKRDKIAKSLEIIHTNGFNAEELVTTWYVNNMGERNSNNSECGVLTMWVDLRNILMSEQHTNAADLLTLAIEKQHIRYNLTDFVENLRMDDIKDKLYSRGVISGKQKTDFQKDKLGLSELITEVVLKSDLQKFKAFKECLKETDQNDLLDMISISDVSHEYDEGYHQIE